ncbi:MAG: transglycosylase SLT domain-containing protein [Alphaproteobacteria bacterium]
MLGTADLQRYRRAFELMREGAFAEAQQVLERVANDMLAGHVTAERLLHRRHRSSFRELAEWMSEHADLPQARVIHAIAMKRRIPGAPLRAPEAPVVEGMAELFDTAAVADQPEGRPATEADRPRETAGRAANPAGARVRQLLRQGDLDGAEKAARAAEGRGLSGEAQRELRADLARFLFFAGRDEKVFDLIPVEGEAAVSARWFAGLASWRLRELDAAARHFEAVASAPGISGWLKAAGGFWAARAHRALGASEAAQAALRGAAEHPVTFYGQLARRTLGDLASYAEGGRPEIEVDALASIPAVRRAIGLLDVGEHELAVQELVAVAKAAPTPVADAVVAFARVAGLRRDVPRITAAIREAEGALFDDAMYPMPRWAPEVGFSVDKALVFAIIKQESNFRSGLVSPRGARGLMQIMPRTAAYITPGAAQPTGHDLDDPAVNLAVGQRFIQHLLGLETVRGNLMLMVAAYNGGIGRVGRWLNEVDHDGDPLLFMEAVPAAETRQFIERVLAAMWIYQLRLGQPSPTLDAVAAGRWPVYATTDDPQRPSVASVEPRQSAETR